MRLNGYLSSTNQMPVKNESLLFLTGMPGAGKSYWAEQLAARFNLQCIDLDQLIEVRTGLSISVFFRRFGERQFRDLEQQTLKQVIEVFPANTVVACGGGTPCFGNSMQLMKEAGRVVYLRSSISQLMDRIRESREQRPLLEGEDLQLRLEALLKARSSCYEQADLVLDPALVCPEDFGFPLPGV